MVFGGWDVFPDTAYAAAAKAKVLKPEHHRARQGRARGGRAHAGRLRPEVRPQPRRPERQEGRHRRWTWRRR
ncbi:MAG: hypothetical protein M0C28_38895 [Candidatus Moduliflexus flocculans]|nr:hypothetical protein [Candidatus Moduliflexus flocculans]